MRRAVIQVCSKPVSKKIRETLQNQRFSYLQSCRRPESNRTAQPRNVERRGISGTSSAAVFKCVQRISVILSIFFNLLSFSGNTALLFLIYLYFMQYNLDIIVSLYQIIITAPSERYSGKNIFKLPVSI